MKFAIGFTPGDKGALFEGLIIFAKDEKGRDVLIETLPEAIILRGCHLMCNPKNPLALERLCMEYLRWKSRRKTKSTLKEKRSDAMKEFAN